MPSFTLHPTHCCALFHVTPDSTTAPHDSTAPRTELAFCCAESPWTQQHTGPGKDAHCTPVLITMRRPWVARSHNTERDKSRNHHKEFQHGSGASHDHRFKFYIDARGPILYRFATFIGCGEKVKTFQVDSKFLHRFSVMSELHT